MDLLTQLQYTIVGTMIRDPDKVGEVMTQLSVADFPSAAAKGIFAAIGDLHFSGAPIDSITVLDKAGEEYGEAILEAQRQYTDDLGYYVGQLKSKNRLRNIQSIAGKIALAESMDQVEPMIDSINLSMMESGRKRSLTPMEAASRMAQRLSEPVSDFLRWGLSSFDRALRVRRGNFIALGGSPGSGKTLLAVQLAALWAQKYRVGFFTLEMTPDEIEERLISHLAQVPIGAIMDHRLTDEQCDAIADAMDRRSRLNLQVEAASGMETREIQAVTLSNRYDIIFVDYLQIAKGKGQTRFEVVTNISQGLATMARRHNIVVVATAQLQRQGGVSPEPTMNSFRESGQIEQDVDVALLLYSEGGDAKEPFRTVKCAKNRNGKTFCTMLAFDGANMTMRQSDRQPKRSRRSRAGSEPAKQDVPDWVLEAEAAGNIEPLV